MPLIKIFNLHLSEERSSILQTLGRQLVQATLDAIPGLDDPNKVHVNLAGSRIIVGAQKPPVFIEVYIHQKLSRGREHYVALANGLAKTAFDVVQECHSSVEVIVDAVRVEDGATVRHISIFPQPKVNQEAK